MPLNQDNSTVEVPQYLKEDIRLLASREAESLGLRKLSMKNYLLRLIAAEKKKAKLK